MPLNCSTPDDVLKAIEDHNVKIVDVRFIDLPGVWQHFSIPTNAFGAGDFSDGIGFDGSSIRGFQTIEEPSNTPTEKNQCHSIVRRQTTCSRPSTTTTSRSWT